MYIAGEVEKPGVYYINEESRLVDLIEMCGGFTQEADISELNLAETLSDSDKVEVPKKTSEEEIQNEEYNEEKAKIININKASKEELKSLNGIGDTLAQNILNYRKNNKFETIEDLLNVEGIGESKFNAIKEYICAE